MVRTVVVAVELLLNVVVKVPVGLGLRVVTGRVKVPLLGRGRVNVPLPGLGRPGMRVGLAVVDGGSVGVAVTLGLGLCSIGETVCVGSMETETDTDTETDTVGDAVDDDDTVAVTELESVGVGVSWDPVGDDDVGEAVTGPSWEGFVLPTVVVVVVVVVVDVAVFGGAVTVDEPLSCVGVPVGLGVVSG